MRGWIQESVMVDSAMASVDTAVLGAVEDIPRKPWYVSFGQLLRKQPLGAAGGLIVLLMLLATVFANVLSPYDPEAASFEHMLMPPNADFWFGTDAFGRDILTRIIYGARTALFVGFTAAFVGATAGLVLGVASAYFGGLFDLIFQRLVDVVMAFPLFNQCENQRPCMFCSWIPQHRRTTYIDTLFAGSNQIYRLISHSCGRQQAKPRQTIQNILWKWRSLSHGDDNVKLIEGSYDGIGITEVFIKNGNGRSWFYQ